MQERSEDNGGTIEVVMLREQARALAAQIPTMYLVLVSNAVFLEFVIAADPLDPTSYWVSYVLAAISAFRMFLWRRNAHRPAPDDERIRRMMTGTKILALLIAIGLAVWSIYLLAAGDPAIHSYIPLFTALSTITCSACLIALPQAAYAVIFAGTLPIALSLLLSGNPSLVATGANLAIITILALGLIKRQHAQFRSMIAAHAETRREEQRSARLALTDALTGLANRRAFLEALAALDVAPAPSSVAVAMFDLDDFKTINDSFGHAAGDALLAAVAARLSDALGPGEMLVRLGGDEFALLMRDSASLSAAHERMTAMSAEFTRPFLVSGRNLRVRTSIGISHSADTDCALTELVHRADLALYEAKAAGGATICTYEAQMARKVRRRMLIEQAASDDTALAALDVAFQPIFATGDLGLQGFEALARWRHPELGEIMPEEFICVVEHRGLTSQLTAALFRKALEQAATWPEPLRLSFNLSSTELTSPDICGIILGMCEKHGFPPRRLSIEITETALLNDMDIARAAIDRLRSAGVQVWLDDFGAGFASIGYLREIRFDGIKLDGSLIRPITESEAARALLSGVLHLCQTIGTPVAAEMVETHAHLDLLRALGVEKVQGYLLGRPTESAQLAGFASRAPGSCHI